MSGTRAHFPGRAQIDSYGNGGFRFAGMSHRGSIMALRDGISEWDVSGPHELDVAAFQMVADQSERPELLIVGTGADIVFVADEVRAFLRDLGVGAEFMSTGAAVRTYNVLLAEDRSVGAALVAVE